MKIIFKNVTICRLKTAVNKVTDLLTEPKKGDASFLCTISSAFFWPDECLL